MQALVNTKLAALAMMLVIFGAGIAVGMVVDRTLAQAAPEPTEVVEEEEEEGEERERRRGYIIERLDLTEDQRTRIEAMLAEYREQMKTFQEESSREYDRIVQETREALKSVLDEEQRATYEALLEERDRRRRN
jgi:Spy/CpxP family protein refolding chaperone